MQCDGRRFGGSLGLQLPFTTLPRRHKTPSVVSVVVAVCVLLVADVDLGAGLRGLTLCNTCPQQNIRHNGCKC